MRNRDTLTKPKGANHLVVFTDLDGTLLDHENYAFEPAVPAIQKLKELSIPLIFCSSKTAAEMRDLQKIIGVSAPFISENGGGIHFPQDSSPAQEPIIIGLPFKNLKKKLKDLRQKYSIKIRMIDELSLEEFTNITGLASCQARKARQRNFSLPFLYENATTDEIHILYRAADDFGLKIIQGGRFFHATGGNDKGVAVKRVIDYYRNLYGYELRTIGLGDSLNDLPMLRIMNTPVIIPNPAITAPLEKALPNAWLAPMPGPRGWNSIISEILSVF